MLDPSRSQPGLTLITGTRVIALRSRVISRPTQSGEPIDAQTLAGIADASLDFVISAHVIEHLRDPIGAIVSAIRVLKPGGIHLLVVPEMRRTFDRDRPETSVAHVLADFRDGGIGTCRDGYEEHLRYVHPILTGQRYSEEEIQRQATEAARLWPKYGAHFHAWTRAGFEGSWMPHLISFLSSLSRQLLS